MKIYKLLSLALCLLLFSGCTTNAPISQLTASPGVAETPGTSPGASPALQVLTQPDIVLPIVTPFLTLEEYPAVDGSTANLPLMAAVMACATGIPLEQAQALTTCTTTPYAYTAMLQGEADLLLIYEGSQSTQQEILNADVKLTLTPIGRDALVFIGNEKNPVQSLTTAQLIDIYTGKYLNWAALGGDDLDIMAFQRVESSGSQALFVKLLMKGTPPMDAPSEMLPMGMGDLIDVVAQYNNEGGAIGFSVYYYASYMYAKPGLKFFGVDGVLPSDETIASGEYPLLNEFYAVVREDAPVNSPARKLAAWLVSVEGRAVIKAAGYIPLEPTA